MIYNLRKKFILISAASVSIVFAVIFGIIYVVTTSELNHTMDMLTTIISENNGVFPKFEEPPNTPPLHSTPPPLHFPQRNIFSADTRFSTRFFTVWTDENVNISKVDIQHILSVSEKEAKEYGLLALKDNKKKGWISNYRYKINEIDSGKCIVFVHGEMNRITTLRLLYSVFAVLMGSFIIILLLIIFISKSAVKPTAESYEKQRQFVTDASHELKTPLTLILSNLDIIQEEIGENEWLEDIRSEGKRMAILIHQLVTLSRMDEDHTNISPLEFSFSDMMADVISEFTNLATEKQKQLLISIPPNLKYMGDEAMIRRLVSILLDNAIKYCDKNGTISVTVSTKGRIFLIFVENTYQNVGQISLDKLFHRFYRADKSRTYTGSFGIGLSIAKEIAKKHKGDITAYQKNETHIGFRVILK